MEKSKKVKVDMNPKKVQNPTEIHKRNPGKFDQKKYMEQENFSAHAIKEMAKIHAMQVHSVSTKYEKDVISMKKRQRRLEHKNTGYVYLKQLRQAFNDENDRREGLAKRLEEFARKQDEPSPQPFEESEDEEEQVKYYKPWEQAKLKPQTRQKTLITEESRPKTNFVQLHGNTGLQSKPVGEGIPCNPVEMSSISQSTRKDYRLDTADKSKLQMMSRDIITATLPVEKLKRIVPPETKNSEVTYPIMSFYRKTTILPEVKRCKQRIKTDMNQLHSRLNRYFGTSFPFSAYTIPKSAKPHKLKLLKAITYEEFTLPHIPPELR